MEENRNLPPEVYEAILHHVTNPEKVIECSKVCEAWKDLIGQERITAAYMSLVLPHLWPYFNVNDMKTMAAVSKRWRNVIDTFDVCEFGSTENWHQLRPPIYLEQVESIQRFLAKFANHGEIENVLNFRTVMISETRSDGLNLEYYQQFTSLVSEFLDKFGHLIFTLDLTSYSGNLFNLVKFVHLCLSKTPFLKNLLLQVQSTKAGCTGEQGEELQTFLNANPFPTSNISYLVFEPNARTPNLIARLMYENYGNQLSLVSNLNVSMCYELQSTGLTLEKLQSVCLNFKGDGDITNLVRFVGLLSTLQFKLVDIELIFRGNFLHQSPSFDAVKYMFIAIKDHQSQIRSVTLKLEQRLWGDYIFPVELLSFLQMENLTKLTLDNFDIPSTDYFMNMPKLVELTILQSKNFDAFVNKDNVTELWGTMKKLRRVKIVKYKAAYDFTESIQYNSRLDLHLFNRRNGSF